MEASSLFNDLGDAAFSSAKRIGEQAVSIGADYLGSKIQSALPPAAANQAPAASGGEPGFSAPPEKVKEPVPGGYSAVNVALVVAAVAAVAFLVFRKVK